MLWIGSSYLQYFLFSIVLPNYLRSASSRHVHLLLVRLDLVIFLDTCVIRQEVYSRKKVFSLLCFFL